MTATLLPQGKQSFETATGAPGVGWKLYTYDSGTNNPRPTWSDVGQTALNANPVIMDARGEAIVFWSGTYRVRLEDNLGNTIWPNIDGVSSNDTSATFLANLAAFNDGAKGAGMVGFGPAISYNANTVGSFLNQIYGRTAGESAAGATVINYYYPPGNVWRYCTALQITNIIANVNQDVRAAIQAAMDSTTGDVYFPTGHYYIGGPLYVKTINTLNLRFVGESRVNTFLVPNAVNIADGSGINALIINQQVNGKFSMYRMRLSTAGGIAWTGICISAVGSGPASQAVIFSGSIDQCWIDPGSTNGGFFSGGLINYDVTNTTFEFMKGCFDFNSTTSDVFFGNISLSTCYDHFITGTLAGNGEYSVEGLHAYNHNRGFLFSISNAYDLKFTDVGVQSAVDNLGTVGLFSLTNCSGVVIDGFSALSNAIFKSTTTAGTTTTVLADSALALTVNQYAGYLLYNFTRGLSQTIISNTANTITTAVIAGQVSGDIYQVLWPTTGLPVGFGTLATAISLNGVRGRFSNGTIRSAAIGIAIAGAAAVDLYFDAIDTPNSVTAGFRVNTGPVSGTVRLTSCDMSDGQLHLVTFNDVATFDYFINGCRFLNAGLGGNTGSQVFAPATSGLCRVNDSVIGQNSASAAANFFVTAAGAGSVIFNNLEVVGTPPSGLKTGAQAVEFVRRRGQCGAITAAANITLPFNGDQAIINGNTNITSMTATNCEGRSVTLIFTGTPTLTDGSNLKLAGNFVATADDAIQLTCDGTNWYQVAPGSVN